MAESNVHFETFANAPITEALLDIQVQLPQGAHAPQLLSYHDFVKKEFPEKRDRLSWSQGLQWQIGQEPKVLPSSQTLEGYMYVSADKRKIVQTRLNSFTFNRLKPYDNWESFSRQARELWEHYRELFSPINIGRLGLRYLNRIEIPLPVADLKAFCVLIPDVPQDIAQNLSEFFLRFVVPDDTSGASGIVTLTFDPRAPGKSVLPLILDIDVFFAFGVAAPGTDDLWRKLAILRQFKNRIFFSSVTESAKNLFR